jgi:hypothetical protein
MLFVRAMMDRAPKLKTVLLKEGDEEPCKECEAMAALPPPVGGIFPRGKDQQEKIAKQLRSTLSATCSPAPQMNIKDRAILLHDPKIRTLLCLVCL